MTSEQHEETIRANVSAYTDWPTMVIDKVPIVAILAELDSIRTKLAQADRANELLSDRLAEVDTHHPDYGAKLQSLTEENARLRAELAEATRKGKELCCTYGNALITEHDLKRELKVANERIAELTQAIVAASEGK